MIDIRQYILPLATFMLIVGPFMLFSKVYSARPKNLSPRAKESCKKAFSKKLVKVSKVERPVFHYQRDCFDQDHVYEFFAAQKGEKKLPVIIVPDVLGGATTDAVVRATLSFHLAHHDVYVPLHAGAQGTICTKFYPITDFSCIELLVKRIGKCLIYSVGSGYLKVDSFLTKSNESKNAQLVFNFCPVSDIVRENFKPEFIGTFAKRNESVFGSNDLTTPHSFEDLKSISDKVTKTVQSKEWKGEMMTVFGNKKLAEINESVVTVDGKHMDMPLKDGRDVGSVIAVEYFAK
ncbi:Alpha/beta_hydrolase family protein [Hexamita inflata]|uniref:Alpha/beta hydrolase family protein n=1 Tax=Hexamita inflata TaxID=28002 RepID=A0AA86N798_9EUKA|nr:Alpha/beta hydrolase family protein [Hexamita inflata]